MIQALEPAFALVASLLFRWGTAYRATWFGAARLLGSLLATELLLGTAMRSSPRLI